jgi:diguanylate cyclase (GGDEF)-like protein/PAS domain S-box-containing protein
MNVKLISSPLSRISFGLVMLTVAILLIADLLGFVPNATTAELKSRKIIAESLAIQLSSEITEINTGKIEELLRSVVERNEVVISAAIKKGENETIYQHGDHNKHWKDYSGGKSTATHVIVPLFSESKKWGSVELTFQQLVTNNLLSLNNTYSKAILFIAVSGFIAYVLFLRRAMRELNPDDVIPERVRRALDTLSEGLMIVDKEGYIVFVNKNFADKLSMASAELVGKDSANLGWLDSTTNVKYVDLPWNELLNESDVTKGVTIKLKSGVNKSYIFNVNTSPVKSPSGRIRGALVTFDDITEIEAKNEELRLTLNKLNKSQKEIMRQNQELHVLATRDPLTGTLNRRSFFKGFEVLFKEALEEETELSCIMLDIDHFKSVNDRFGHAAGDKVIKYLASLLNEHSRSNDLVGRLGGEEFCVVLPGANKEVACKVAERIRSVIQNGEGAEFANAVRITSSFGVSSLASGAKALTKLLEQADQALYQAKERGRNRVILWSSELLDDFYESKPESTSVVEMDDNLVRGKDSSFVTPEHSYKENVIAIAERSHEKNVPQLYSESHRVDSDSIFHGGEKCLPSHLIVLDRIDQAINRAKRFNSHIAVMVLDAPALKYISDTMGYISGEKLLATIVGCVKEVMRDTDTVSIIENDELLFSVSLVNKEIVILLTDLSDSEAVVPILQRIFSISNQPVTVEGTEIFIGMNVGVSLYPLDGSDSEALIKHASSALHEAEKLSSRNNFHFYSREINQLSKKRIQLEVELHHALQREEFVVHYQPKVDLKTGDILGMEALIRWRHPRLGLVPPNEFIPIAEHNGQITDISLWLIHTVCKQILHWKQTGYGIVPVSINISAVDFRNPELGDSIIEILEKYELPGNSMEIEITETAVMQNIDTAVTILDQLQKAGLSISIDDFGTGYSSLSYLKRFTLSKVKIDRSFITEFTTAKNDAALVSAIIAMGHSLGLKVVAEGVETDEQLRFLQDLHCDEIQGYLISRPVPAEEVSNLLARSSSIKRLITDYGIANSGLAIHHNPGATTMMGILNEYDDSSKVVQA